MSDTVIVVKLYLEEPGVEDAIVAQMKTLGIGQLKDVKIEPLAFGLNSIRAAYTIPEGKEEMAEQLIVRLKQISGVTEAEVEAMSLL